MLDSLILHVDRALRAVSITPQAHRVFPQADVTTSLSDLSDNEQRHTGALMRVNHVGEICAQALYHGQAAATKNDQLRQEFLSAAQDEADHLAWTRQRLEELQSRPSLLNPLWYGGALLLGWLAGRSGDAPSLGFVVETERQVEQHLTKHLHQLPANDHRSRALLEQMRSDEARHADTARRSGASELPLAVKLAMRCAAKIMTTTAYWV